MSEEEALPTIKPRQGTTEYGETLLYDYSKFITSLSLLALGGVLSLSQTGAFEKVAPNLVGAVVMAMALSGASGFHVASTLVTARSAGNEPPLWLKWWVRIGTYSLAVGTGVFLSVFWDAIR